MKIKVPLITTLTNCHLSGTNIFICFSLSGLFLLLLLKVVLTKLKKMTKSALGNSNFSKNVHMLRVEA